MLPFSQIAPETLALLVAVLLALVALLIQFRRIRSLERDLAGLLQSNGLNQSSFFAVVQDASRMAEQAQADNRRLQGVLSSVPRHTGLVRFDVLDQGGGLSFSLALMNDHHNGVVLTSMAGRDSSRIYAKALTGGQSDRPLSPEESRAVAIAMRSGADEGMQGSRAK